MVKPKPWQILKQTTADSRLVVDVIRISGEKKMRHYEELVRMDVDVNEYDKLSTIKLR